MEKTYSSAARLTSRCLLAVVGGYLTTYMATAAMARILPMKPVDAVVTASLLGFVIYLLFIILSFVVSKPSTIALSLLINLPLGMFGFWPQMLELMQ